MNKEILRLSIPNIISNITVPLIGMVDVALMGHLNDSIYLAAVALGSVIFNLLFMSFSFLRMSTTGFTAQAYGAENHARISEILQRATIIAISISALILLIQMPLAYVGFSVLEGDAETKEIARMYYNIRIWSAPASMMMYVFMGWFVGMQNTRFPMIISIAINLLNIVLSVLFVRFFDLHAAGVALGTVLAEYLGLILAFLLFKRHYSEYSGLISIKILLQKQPLIQFFKINSNLFIRSLILIGALSFFTSRGASLGNEILAINSILMQYFLVFSYFLDGFAYAAEALTGRFAGSRDKANFALTISYIFRWGWALTVLFGIFFLVAYTPMIRLLTNNSELVSQAFAYRFWMAAIPLSSFAAFIWDGIFVGTLSTQLMRKAMIIAGILVYLPAVYFLMPLWGNHGLWIAFLLFMGSRSLAMWYYSPKIVFQTTAN